MYLVFSRLPVSLALCFFFFFKQKTAYEIGVRLVGSEMCIRDRTVAGTNYRILCEATTVYPGAEMHYAVVNVYESLEGNANIISVTDGYVS